MSDYFKPTRCKIGIAMLALALVFAAGWLRSHVVADQVSIRIGDDRLFWLISNDEWIGWADIQGGATNYPESSVSYWNSIPLPNHRNGGPFSGIDHSWDWHMRGYLILPYLLIVIPLTVLSVWLLFSKPRKPKSEATRG